MHPPPQAHTDLQPMHMCKYSHDTVRAEGQPACTQLLTGNEETTTQRLRPTDTPSTVHIIIVTKIKNVQMRGDAGTSGMHRADEQKNGTRFNVMGLCLTCVSGRSHQAACFQPHISASLSLFYVPAILYSQSILLSYVHVLPSALSNLSCNATPGAVLNLLLLAEGPGNINKPSETMD